VTAPVEQRDVQPDNVLQHRSLRAAINAAATALDGLVDKAGVNEQYHYAYVGHSHVIDHVRGALLEHGVVVLATDLRFVQSFESRNSTLYLWEQKFQVEHEHSADSFEAKVQVTTLPGEQSAAKASTAADRTFLMRLCRLAGKTDQDDGPRQQRGRAPAMGPRADERNQGAKPRSTGRQPAHDANGEVPMNATERAVAELLAELVGLDKAPAARLSKYFADARAALEKADATEAQRARVWKAFEKRCKDSGHDAKRIAGQK
jgi:hypothetical protein